MLCKKCNKQVSILDNQCPHCGYDLTKVDVEKRYVDFPKSKWVNEVEKKWKAQVSFSSSFKNEGVDGYRPWGSMMNEIKEMVFANPYVTGNPLYCAKSKDTEFIYDQENLNVNAYASFGENGSRIVFFEGYLNLLFAIEAIFKHLSYANLTTLGKTLFENNFHLHFEEIFKVVNVELNEEIIRNSFISSFETIAHELGHICLDHIFSPKQSLDVSRNMERQADEFAASLISSSAFSDKLFIAHIKCCVAWAVIEKVGGVVEPNTHPLALERLRNAIRNNLELAQNLDIDEDWVTKLFG